MKRILVLAFCIIFAILPESLGLHCYTCTAGDKDGRPCEEFKKLGNETEKQAKFGTLCEAEATGCSFTKGSSGDGRIKLDTEALSCYEPEEKLEKIVKMGECVENGGPSQKICVCNTGNYCIEGGSSAINGILGLVLASILASSAAVANFI